MTEKGSALFTKAHSLSLRGDHGKSELKWPKARENIFFKSQPGVLVGCVVVGTELAGDVVVTDDIIRVQMIGVGQIAHQLDKGAVGFLSKRPGAVRVAALDGNRVHVSGVGAVSFLVERDALQDGAVHSDDKGCWRRSRRW